MTMIDSTDLEPQLQQISELREVWYAAVDAIPKEGEPRLERAEFERRIEKTTAAREAYLSACSDLVIMLNSLIRNTRAQL